MQIRIFAIRVPSLWPPFHLGGWILFGTLACRLIFVWKSQTTLYAPSVVSTSTISQKKSETWLGAPSWVVLRGNMRRTGSGSLRDWLCIHRLLESQKCADDPCLQLALIRVPLKTKSAPLAFQTRLWWNQDFRIEFRLWIWVGCWRDCLWTWS